MSFVDKVVFCLAVKQAPITASITGHADPSPHNMFGACVTRSIYHTAATTHHTAAITHHAAATTHHTLRSSHHTPQTTQQPPHTTQQLPHTTHYAAATTHHAVATLALSQLQITRCQRPPYIDQRQVSVSQAVP